MYINEIDLVSRFGQLEIQQLSDRNNMGAIDSSVVETAINEATAQIDSYLAGTYTLPLAAVPANLQRIAADLVRYQLYDIKVPETVQKRRDNAIEYLTQVSKGLVSLGVANVGNEQVQVNQAGGVKSVTPGRVFNSNSLAGY